MSSTKDTPGEKLYARIVSFRWSIATSTTLQDEIYVRFITPAIALKHNTLSSISPRTQPLPASTTISDLRKIVAKEVFSINNVELVTLFSHIDIHFSSFPILSDHEEDTLSDYGF